ncbi:MAG: hypothetical protein JJE09_07495 [Bacteroidia bacterium]|nr:hypothetical protein [Bacteroidia bacterium]
MLRFFRINDPYRLIGLLIILILLALPFFIDPIAVTLVELRSMVIGEAVRSGKLMYIQVYDSTAPLAAAIFGLVDWIFGRSLVARHSLSLLIIFFQSSFFAIVLIVNKAYNDSSYVPALIFGLLCFLSFDFLSFSPELLASTFLLLALNNLFKEIEFRNQRDENLLSLGVYLGLATLLVFSYSVFLLATLFILISFTRIDIRKGLLLLVGFGLPHGMLITLYFFWGNTVELWQNYYLPNISIGGASLISAKSLFTLGIVPIIYFVFSMFMLNREAHFTKYQSQLFQVIFLWLVVAVIHIFIVRDRSPQSLIIIVPSLSYLVSHYLLLIRRKALAELMLWLLLISLVSVNLLTRYDFLKRVNFEAMFPKDSPYEKLIKDKHVMMLCADEGIYRQNKLAGYFPDWSLSASVFEEPDYYENIILIDEAFRTDPPEIIVDPKDLMKKIFHRIPRIKPLYKKEGDLYRRI